MKKTIVPTDNGLVNIPSFDFEHAQPNRFVERYHEGVETIVLNTGQKNIILLEPDVAEYFPDSESVNTALRVLITAISQIKKPTVAS